MLRTLFDDLYGLNREMNRIFNSYNTAEDREGWANSNIYENNDEYIIVTKIPGGAKEDINITLKDNSLKISGERKKQKGEKDALLLGERFSGKFERNFLLNEKIDTDKTHAEVKNGILMLKMPKSPESKPKKIEIN